MNTYIKPTLIGLLLVIASACKKNNTHDSEIEIIYQQAENNYRISRDSTAYFLNACLNYDTLQLSELSLARIYHIKGLYYETKLRYDSAAFAFSYGASLLNDNNYKGVLLMRAATVAARANEFDNYNSYIDEAEKLVKKFGAPAQEASFYATKGEYYLVIDDYESAIPLLTKADSILEANDILRPRDYYCYRLGFCYRRLSKYPEAFKCIEKSIDLSLQLNNVAQLAGNYIDLSRMYRNSKRFDEALEWQEKHLELVYEINDLLQIQRGLENMGIIYAETEQWDKAESYFFKSLETSYEIDDPHSIGDALSNMGNFYYRRGNMDKAYSYYEQSYVYRQENRGTPISMLSSLFHLGDVDLVRKDYASAEANLQKASFLADSVHQTKWLVLTTKRLADLYKQKGDYNKYADALEQYVTAKDKWNSELKNTNFNKLSLQYEKKHNEAVIAMQADRLKIGRLLLIIISISLIFVISISAFIFIHKAARLKAFRAIYRQQLLVKDQKRVIDSLLKEVNTIKPKKSENELRSRLVELLEKQEIYKNQDISLELVANKLATNITYVSKLVNSEFNCNFNTLINQHRINYCKSCIRNNEEKIPMKSIGLNAGFKSQSTFYATFKEFVGMTPLQYAKISKLEMKQNTIAYHA